MGMFNCTGIHRCKFYESPSQLYLELQASQLRGADTRHEVYCRWLNANANATLWRRDPVPSVSVTCLLAEHGNEEWHVCA